MEKITLEELKQNFNYIFGIANRGQNWSIKDGTSPAYSVTEMYHDNGDHQPYTHDHTRATGDVYIFPESNCALIVGRNEWTQGGYYKGGWIFEHMAHLSTEMDPFLEHFSYKAEDILNEYDAVWVKLSRKKRMNYFSDDQKNQIRLMLLNNCIEEIINNYEKFKVGLLEKEEDEDDEDLWAEE